jgi:hypothetical protein
MQCKLRLRRIRDPIFLPSANCHKCKILRSAPHEVLGFAERIIPPVGLAQVDALFVLPDSPEQLLELTGLLLHLATHDKSIALVQGQIHQLVFKGHCHPMTGREMRQTNKLCRLNKILPVR